MERVAGFQSGKGPEGVLIVLRGSSAVVVATMEVSEKTMNSVTNVSDVNGVSGVGGVGGVNEELRATAKPKRKWPKFLLRGAVVFAAALALGQLMYTFSGDGKWNYVDQGRGVTVYSLKNSGTNVKKFMAVFRVKGTLSQVTAFLTDSDSDMGDGGFADARVLQRESPQVYWTYWTMPLASPMSKRDYVVKHVVTQDPKTKEVLYALTAKPYMLPEEKCCIRVLKMDNSWRLTPINADEVEIHWVIDMNIGGTAPYFMVNKWFPWEMLNFGPSFQEIVNRKKYVGIKLDWIQDL
jgi:hypothetical protein